MPEAVQDMAKPKIDRLLVDSALQPELRKHLLESPDEVLRDYDLTEEEKDILRRPDYRLLQLLGATLARQMETAGPPRETLAAILFAAAQGRGHLLLATPAAAACYLAVSS
jgi:hypothetical protein